MRMKRGITLLLVFVSFAICLLCPFTGDAKIVFSARMKHLGQTRYHIYAMEDDGSNLRRITPPHRYDHSPNWFPDGKRILFERDWGEGKWNTGDTIHREFFIIDVTGMNEHRFMDTHRKDGSPVVSPDGRTIAFHSTREGKLDIYTYDLEREELTQLTQNNIEGGWTQAPSWSPDSKRIVYVNGNDIWVMDADGGRKKQITPIHEGNTILEPGAPYWSPSGKYIMYNEVALTPDRMQVVTNRLIVLSVATGARVVHNFPKTSAFFGGLAWMGTDTTVLIAYKDPDAARNIYRYHLTSRKMTKLTDFPLGHAYDPHWVEGTLSVSPQDKVTTQWGYLKQKLAK